MECFNCHRFSQVYCSNENDSECFCGHSCVQSNRAVAIGKYLINLEKGLDRNPPPMTARCINVERMFLRAILKRSRKEQLIKFKQVLMNAYVDLLEEVADNPITTQKDYLEMTETSKINLDEYDNYIEIFSS